MATDLDDVLGTLVAAVAHARRIADEESAVIAEHYREHPVLGGMSVPRVRLPEVTVDLPVVVDTYHEGGSGVVAAPNNVHQSIRAALKETAAERGTRLPSGLLTAYKARFDQLAKKPPPAHRATASYGNAAETALLDVLRTDRFTDSIEPDHAEAIREAVRTSAESAAFVQPAAKPRFAVSVVTSDVREASPDTVARLSFKMVEEGMEWTMIDQADGTTRRRLIPE